MKELPPRKGGFAPSTWTITVPLADNGQRADLTLANHVPGLSRRLVKQLALKGHLLANGTKIEPSFRVTAGLTLELLGELAKEPTLASPPAKLLRATEKYLYFNKPSGMHTVGRYPDQPGTLATQVAEQFPECRQASPDLREAGALHRLDQLTSGIVAFARDPKSWEKGRCGFSQHTARKLYIARCYPESEGFDLWPPNSASVAFPSSNWIQHGSPIRDLSVLPEPFVRQSVGEPVCVLVRAPIGRGSQRDQVSIRADGHPSESLIQSWISPRSQREAQISNSRPTERLMLIDLLSGTRHQARIHLAWLGWPIKNDTKYGVNNATGPLMLHAYMLDLSQFEDREVRIFCDPPSYFFNPGANPQ